MTYNILSVGMFEFMIKYILSQIILHVLHLPKLNWFIIHFNNYFWLYQVCDAFILEKEKLFYSEKKTGRKCNIVYKQKLLSVGFSVSECCGAKFDIYVICRTFFPENGSHQRAFCANTIIPS